MTPQRQRERRLPASAHPAARRPGLDRRPAADRPFLRARAPVVVFRAGFVRYARRAGRRDAGRVPQRERATRRASGSDRRPALPSRFSPRRRSGRCRTAGAPCSPSRRGSVSRPAFRATSITTVDGEPHRPGRRQESAEARTVLRRRRHDRARLCARHARPARHDQGRLSDRRATRKPSSTSSCAARSAGDFRASGSSTPATCSPDAVRHRSGEAADAPSGSACATSRRSGRSGSTSVSRSTPSRARAALGLVHHVRTGVLVMTRRQTADCRMQIAACGASHCSCCRLPVALLASRAQRRSDRPRARGRRRQPDHVERRERGATIWGWSTPRDSGDRVRDVLSQLIDRELQLAEVDRYAPPEPSAAEVDREVQIVQARFASPASLRRRPRASRASISRTCAKRCARTCVFARTSSSAFRSATSAGSRWSTTGWRDCAGAPTSSTCIWSAGNEGRSGSWVGLVDQPGSKPAYDRVMTNCSDLQQVEAGVADHRRHRRSPPQVDDAPERAEQPRDDRRRRSPASRWPAPNAALVTITPTDAAAQPDLEAMQQERALNLLADASGHEHDEREQPRVARRAEETLERILLQRCAATARSTWIASSTPMPAPSATTISGMPYATSSGDRPRPEEHVARTLAVRAEKQHDQADEQRRCRRARARRRTRPAAGRWRPKG